MNGEFREPGWDKKAVNRIARESYGGRKEMFEAHGWSADGRVISQIAPTKVVETYGSVKAFELAARTIGRRGRRLTRQEARKLLSLPLVEISVYGGQPVDFVPPAKRGLALATSPVPVSQQPYVVREAEGEKHLYVLRLTGELEGFIEERPAGRNIVKVGFSVRPDNRKKAFNAALSGGRIVWEVYRSTFIDGRPPFASSGHALAGEQALKNQLSSGGRSLGGEFFLADESSIARAWQAGVEAAEKRKS